MENNKPNIELNKNFELAVEIIDYDGYKHIGHIYNIIGNRGVCRISIDHENTVVKRGELWYLTGDIQSNDNR